jgi:hypothetical protein
MTDQPPSPFTLNRTRIIILVLGALAVTFIIGAITGGVGNYQTLREAASSAREDASSSSVEP